MQQNGEGGHRRQQVPRLPGSAGEILPTILYNHLELSKKVLSGRQSFLRRMGLLSSGGKRGVGSIGGRGLGRWHKNRALSARMRIQAGAARGGHSVLILRCLTLSAHLISLARCIGDVKLACTPPRPRARCQVGKGKDGIACVVHSGAGNGGVKSEKEKTATCAWCTRE